MPSVAGREQTRKQAECLPRTVGPSRWTRRFRLRIGPPSAFARGPSGLIVLLLAAAVLFPACRRVTQQASSFNVADPARSNQLLYGFYGVEAKPSRWTARKFSFMLKPPVGAVAKGGKLWMRLFVPDLQIQKIGPMTLAASIDGYSLSSQEFTQGGMYVYTAQIPAELKNRDLSDANKPDERVQKEILRLYQEAPECSILFELMTDFDEGLQEWRYRHIKLVERTIGAKRGTGGSPGVPFLKESLFKPIFHDLWAIRHQM